MLYTCSHVFVQVDNLIFAPPLPPTVQAFTHRHISDHEICNSLSDSKSQPIARASTKPSRKITWDKVHLIQYIVHVMYVVVQLDTHDCINFDITVNTEFILFQVLKNS